MKKTVALLFLLMFAFIGCQNKQLSSPKNVAYDYEGYIIWEEVENADHYLIKIEEHEFVTQIAMYDIKDVITKKGNYDVEIIAVSEDYESSNPVVFSINVDYNLDATLNFDVQGTTLNWNEVFLASHYLVSYDFEFVRVDGTSFDLSTLPTGEFILTVQAVFPDGSKTETFTTNYTK